jgi:DNA-binding LacI/PurR family transcriptional regulator
MAISDGKLPYQLYPKISHIHHSGSEVGMKAAKVLMEIKNKEFAVNHYKVDTELIDLDSVFV